MNRALVIGGSGFMGSYIADTLSEQGCQVSIFDIEPSPWLRDEQSMIVGDILDREQLNECMRDIDVVYHLAGIADIQDASVSPYDTVESNVMGTTAVLDAAVANKIVRFVYASTVYVYSPFGSFYRASKQAAETIIEAYAERYDLKYTLLRYGSLYGPRSQAWNGLRRWVSQAVLAGKIDYRGIGKERREYIHVEDAAQLSTKILDKKYENTAVTITGTQVLTSSELLSMIEEICGKKLDISYTDEYESNYHYLTTPYRYTPKTAKKLIPEEFVDIGQGILDLVEEVSEQGNVE